MKVRNGFVSNSSSSSFIVAWKGELDEGKILKALNIEEKSPLYSFAQDIARFIINEEKTIYQSWDKYKEEYMIKDDEEEDCRTKELFNKGLTVGEFYASYNDSDNPTEIFLGQNDYFKVISDDFVLLGEYAL